MDQSFVTSTIGPGTTALHSALFICVCQTPVLWRREDCGRRMSRIGRIDGKHTISLSFVSRVMLASHKVIDRPCRVLYRRFHTEDTIIHAQDDHAKCEDEGPRCRWLPQKMRRIRVPDEASLVVTLNSSSRSVSRLSVRPSRRVLSTNDREQAVVLFQSDVSVDSGFGGRQSDRRSDFWSTQ